MLARFAAEYGIDYDMLSDVGSETIEALGLLNDHIREQQAFFGKDYKERHHRLPYPGTFVLDEDGVVVSKTFEDSYRDRPSADYLLMDSEESDLDPRYEAIAVDRGITLRARVTDQTYLPLQKTMLRLRLDIADGHHIYVEPVPDGYQALEVELVRTDGVASWEPKIPTGRPHAVEGLNERFHVLEGTVDLALPFKVAGSGHDVVGRERAERLDDGDVTLTAIVRYQVCTDDRCFPPSERRLAVPLVEGELIR